MFNPKKITRIEINFIPKEDQRLACYRKEGCADYYLVDKYWHSGNVRPEKTLVINVSRSKDWRPQWLVLLHEIIEITLVLHQKISFKKIDEFDEAHLDHEDPGSIPFACYHKAHVIAESQEKLLASQIGVDWGSY